MYLCTAVKHPLACAYIPPENGRCFSSALRTWDVIRFQVGSNINSITTSYKMYQVYQTRMILYIIWLSYIRRRWHSERQREYEKNTKTKQITQSALKYNNNSIEYV